MVIYRLGENRTVKKQFYINSWNGLILTFLIKFCSIQSLCSNTKLKRFFTDGGIVGQHETVGGYIDIP